ncbi:hypothetical protein Xenpb_03528 [Xenorhabdus sp. PB62.4]|nr:hypothetical protein [Xenorhabdus sp. PB62.4]
MSSYCTQIEIISFYYMKLGGGNKEDNNNKV